MLAKAHGHCKNHIRKPEYRKKTNTAVLSHYG